MIKNTVVDLGNMFVKYSGETMGNFSSKISTDFHAYEEGFDRVEIEGKKTYIGTGELSKEFNKVDKDFKAQLFFAICRANNNEEVIDTNLTLLLPALQMSNKPKLIEMLQGKEFMFKLNNKDKIIRINDCAVMPEGYMVYFALDEETKKKDICIVDIGSRTVNICALEDSKIQNIQTLKLGSFDLYSKIKVIESAKGEALTEEDVVRMVENGKIKVDDSLYVDFVNEIMNNIKPYINLRKYDIVFAGGTSLLLKQYLNGLNLPYATIMEDSFYANVIGATKTSEMIWKLKNEQ